MVDNLICDIKSAANLLRLPPVPIVRNSKFYCRSKSSLVFGHHRKEHFMALIHFNYMAAYSVYVQNKTKWNEVHVIKFDINDVIKMKSWTGNMKEDDALLSCSTHSDGIS